nr:uncharacterized protein LOC127316032 [Lolium perenne]
MATLARLPFPLGSGRVMDAIANEQKKTSLPPSSSPWRRRCRPPLAKLKSPGDPPCSPLPPRIRNRPKSFSIVAKFADSFSNSGEFIVDSGSCEASPVSSSAPRASGSTSPATLRWFPAASIDTIRAPRWSTSKGCAPVFLQHPNSSPADPAPTGPQPRSAGSDQRPMRPNSIRHQARQIRPRNSAAFASSRIGSRSVDVRYDEFSDKFFCSFSQVRDGDVSKVTLPAWPGQGYGRSLLSSRTLSPISSMAPRSKVALNAAKLTGDLGATAGHYRGTAAASDVLCWGEAVGLAGVAAAKAHPARAAAAEGHVHHRGRPRWLRHRRDHRDASSSDVARY